MKKRILSFVLALVMAVSLLPVSVLAAEKKSLPFTLTDGNGAAFSGGFVAGDKYGDVYFFSCKNTDLIQISGWNGQIRNDNLTYVCDKEAQYVQNMRNIPMTAQQTLTEFPSLRSRMMV